MLAKAIDENTGPRSAPEGPPPPARSRRSTSQASASLSTSGSPSGSYFTSASGNLSDQRWVGEACGRLPVQDGALAVAACLVDLEVVRAALANACVALRCGIAHGLAPGFHVAPAPLSTLAEALSPSQSLSRVCCSCVSLRVLVVVAHATALASLFAGSGCCWRMFLQALLVELGTRRSSPTICRQLRVHRVDGVSWCCRLLLCVSLGGLLARGPNRDDHPFSSDFGVGSDVGLASRSTRAPAPTSE